MCIVDSTTTIIQFKFYHKLIGSHYFDFVVLNTNVFFFGLGFHNIGTKIEGVHLKHSTSDHKTSLRDNY